MSNYKISFILLVLTVRNSPIVLAEYLNLSSKNKDKFNSSYRINNVIYRQKFDAKTLIFAYF